MAVPVTSALQNQVAQYYIALLGRNPDPEGFSFWVNTLAAGGNTTADQNAVIIRFGNEPEFKDEYGGLNTTQAVTRLYQNVLLRQPDSGGLTYWSNYANNLISQGQPPVNAYALTAAQIIANASSQGSSDAPGINARIATAVSTGTTETYTLTTNPDTATAQVFIAPKAYTPGGNDLVNTLQNEDVLTGNTLLGATSLTADIGNPNDSGAFLIAPTLTDIQTVNVSFTNTVGQAADIPFWSGGFAIEGDGMTLDFQDISGTTTANITRISANLRDSFINLGSEVTNLGIANTSEQAKVTITYLNNELASANNAVTLTLNNANLSTSQFEYDIGDNPFGITGGAALKIEATEARGSDLQNQIETYNIVTAGSVGSSVATFKTGVSDYNDNVVGQRPVTMNITTGATASLAIGTLRWQSNRVETNSANVYLVNGNHQVGTNGLGFVDVSQIRTINVAGSSNVTLANVGNWVNLNPEATSVDNVNFTLNASTFTGVLTADITNAAGSIYSTITGGSGSDRFYVSGYTGDNESVTATSANVVASVSGGTGIDSLTVQGEGGTVNLAAGSTGMEFLNLVSSGEGGWSVDLSNGGFTAVTMNNQDNTSAMTVSIVDMNASTTSLSVRSAGLTSIGDNATTAQGDVNITFAQAAGITGGTLSLALGATADDRAVNDAFSARNHTSNVSIVDGSTDGSATAVTSLALQVNSAGASGAGAAQINVAYGDFQTLTTLTSGTGNLVNGTNAVTIGVGAGNTAATNSTYASPTNALNSTTYNGAAYAGNQNVTFGSALAGQAVAKSHNITTGSGVDTVDLSYMGTNAGRTAANFAVSSYLLGTVINMGTGTGDQLILSGTLADPRQVLNADITYDGYFANWSNVDILTINNRNAMGVSPGTNSNAATTAYVGVDAYAQINNAGLTTFNFNDVSGELAVGFRFTNNFTINTDASETVTTKWTTLNSFSSGNNTINIDASAGIASAAGNLVQYTNSGANLANTVTLNYNSIDNSGASITTTELVVQNSGSIDYVDFNGDLGLTAAAGGDLTVTAPATWVAANQLATFDASSIVNTQASDGNTTVTIDLSLEVNALGLTILGSTDGGSATVGVNNVITGGASVANTITSAGYSDILVGGSAADTITYTGNSGVATNAVSITAGAGADTITLNSMVAGELSTVIAGAGNDTVTLSLGTTTYSFASVVVESLASALVSSVAEMVLNVGQDTVSGINVTANDVISIEKDVFGTDIDNAGALASFQQVASTSTILATSTTNSIVVVQSAANANASMYYVAPDITAANTSIDVLVQAGSAVLIGQFTSVTGLFDATDFVVV